MTRPNHVARTLLMLLPNLSLGWATVVRSEDSPHLKMGNPTQASADPDHKSDFLVVKPFYALSYNDVKGTPNWVSWRLSRGGPGQHPTIPLQARP